MVKKNIASISLVTINVHFIDIAFESNLYYLRCIVWFPIATIVMQMRCFIAQYIEDVPSYRYYGTLVSKKYYIISYILHEYT